MEFALLKIKNFLSIFNKIEKFTLAYFTSKKISDIIRITNKDSLSFISF